MTNCKVFNHWISDSYTGQLAECGGEIKQMGGTFTPHLGVCQRCGLVYDMRTVEAKSDG